MNKLVQGVALAIALGLASSAHATVVTWNLLGVTFDDGTKASGFFTFDDTVPGFLTDFKIGTTSGTLPGFTYLPSTVGPRALTTRGITLSVAPVAGIGLFAASDLFDPLDNSLVLSGTIPLTGISFEGRNGVFRYITGGSVTTIPEPSALAFLAIGIGVLALLRRLTH